MSWQKKIWRNALSQTVVGLAGLMGIFLYSSPVQAVTKTYIFSGFNEWHNDANWSPSGVPTLSDDVIVLGSSGPSQFVNVQPGEPKILFNSLTIEGSSFSLFNDISPLSGSVTVKNGGTLFLSSRNEQSITGDLLVKTGGTIEHNWSAFGKIDISARNITIEPNGYINASERGFYVTAVGENGAGPGAGQGSIASSAGGAGSGGNGGNAAGGALGGSAYCNASDITTLNFGSSGGSAATPGGNGGGFIRLVARGTLNINGASIWAAGENSRDPLLGGGGSGGSIYLYGNVITGTPFNLAAPGGNGGTDGGGGGGGGCILVRYGLSSSLTNPASFNVVGGTGSNAGMSGSTAIQRAPAAPGNFTFSQLSTSSFNLNWIWGGGSIEDHYVLEVSLDGTNFNMVSSTLPTTTLSYSVTGAPFPASRYVYRISAVSSTVGVSEYATTSAYTFPLDPATPSLSLLTPTSLKIDFSLNGNPALSPVLYGSLIMDSHLGTTYFKAPNTVTSSQAFFPVTAWTGDLSGLTPSTSYQFTTYLGTLNEPYGSYLVSAPALFTTTTPLATPTTPTISSASTSSIALTWTQNGNPATTPYAVYNKTLNQYHLANGTLSATPVFYPLSSWNGSAKELTPSTKYLFQIVLRNEDGTQNATSTENGTYTNNPDNTSFSLGGSSSSGGGAATTTSPGGTTSTGWYFGTPGSSTTYPTTTGSTTSPLAPTPGGTTNYYLPDGTLITPQLIFQMMMNANNTPSLTFGSTPVSLYKGKNLASNILFSKFSTQANPLKVGSTLSFRYTYNNPNKTGSYRIERVLLNPLGKVVTRSTISSRTISQGQTITYNPSQYLSTTLTTGLYTMRIRITSPDTKTIYDENTFDVSVKK